jgi:hypothetical protein
MVELLRRVIANLFAAGGLAGLAQYVPFKFWFVIANTTVTRPMYPFADEQRVSSAIGEMPCGEEVVNVTVLPDWLTLDIDPSDKNQFGRPTPWENNA